MEHYEYRHSNINKSITVIHFDIGGQKQTQRHGHTEGETQREGRETERERGARNLEDVKQ